MIENMLHKHRYFGHSGAIYECRPWSVTIVSPMKRGLKAYNAFAIGAQWSVTIVSPMKRGLKVESKVL